MRIAYLDCFSGISGDMFLGALVDAGVSPKVLEEAVAALDVGARLEISRAVRGGIAATKVDVYSHGEKDLPREVFWEQHERGHSPAHSHSHGHEHEAGVRQHSRSQHFSRAGAPAPHAWLIPAPPAPAASSRMALPELRLFYVPRELAPTPMPTR